MRVDRLGQKLDVFGLENFRQGWVPRWLEEMDKLEFQICLVAGKANSKGKLKIALQALASTWPQGCRCVASGIRPL